MPRLVEELQRHGPVGTARAHDLILLVGLKIRNGKESGRYCTLEIACGCLPPVTTNIQQEIYSGQLSVAPGFRAQNFGIAEVRCSWLAVTVQGLKASRCKSIGIKRTRRPSNHYGRALLEPVVTTLLLDFRSRELDRAPDLICDTSRSQNKSRQ